MSVKLKGILTFVAVAGVAGAASAADIYQAPPPISSPIYAPAPVAINWTGFYAGLNGGYGWGKADHLPGPTSGTGINDFNVNGWIFGGQIGANWQTASNLVLGVETDIQWSGIDGSCAAGVCGVPQSTSHKLNWYGTLRGRLGFAAGEFMPYITGGLAYGNATRTTSSGGGASDSQTHVGWTAGIGAEWMFAQNWSVKAEYNYMDLGNRTYDFPAGFDPIVDLKVHTVRAGINYHF